MQNIEFFEQYEWDEARGAMLFWAKLDDKTLACRVTEAALRAIGGDTDGETPGAELFMENTEAVHAVASRMIRDGKVDAKGELTIDDADCVAPE